MVQTLEPKIVKLLNEFFTQTQQCAKAIRLKQPQPYGGYQDCDILVLGRGKYNLAIECKSVLEPSNQKIYFKSYFTTDKQGRHQIPRMTEFCSLTGLTGILVVELRSGVKNSWHEVYFVPWRVVNALFVNGVGGITYDEVRKWPRFERTKGTVNLDECLTAIRYDIDE